MSLIKAIKQQLGLSNTQANNFTLDASADNGTMKLARNSGQDIMSVDVANNVVFSKTAIASDLLISNGQEDGGNLNFASLGRSSWGMDNFQGSLRFINDGVPGSVAMAISPAGGVRVSEQIITPILQVGTSPKRSLDCSTPIFLDAAGVGTFYINLQNFSGLLVINDFSSGKINLYLCGGGAVFLVGGSSNPICIVGFIPGINGYNIENTGAARQVGVFAVSTRNAA